MENMLDTKKDTSNRESRKNNGFEKRILKYPCKKLLEIQAIIPVANKNLNKTILGSSKAFHDSLKAENSTGTSKTIENIEKSITPWQILIAFSFIEAL